MPPSPAPPSRCHLLGDRAPARPSRLPAAAGQAPHRAFPSDASRADALEDSLVLVLTRLQPKATRFSFPNHELSSRKSQAVEIDDEEALDPQWLSFTTTSKPDKAAIKEALKAGTEITGAQLISRRSWRIC